MFNNVSCCFVCTSVRVQHLSQRSHLLHSFHLQVWPSCFCCCYPHSYVRTYIYITKLSTLYSPFFISFVLFLFIVYDVLVFFMLTGSDLTLQVLAQWLAVCLFSPNVLIGESSCESSSRLATLLTIVSLLYTSFIVRSVLCKSKAGKTIPLEVVTCFIVENVKALIHSKEGIPQLKQRIILPLKTLEDGHKLSGYSSQSSISSS